MFNASVSRPRPAPTERSRCRGSTGDLSIAAERYRHRPQHGTARVRPGLQPERAGADHRALRLAVGAVSQAGQPAPGILITCQSVATPGVVFTAPSAADGTYAFDQLAADTYKVSATLRNGRRGMQFYSQQATVASGGAAIANLTADGGQVTLTVAVTARSGTLAGGMAWLAGGQITPANARDLQAQVAALGPSNSQLQFVRGSSQNVVFDDVWNSAYTLCIVPWPVGLRGQQAMAYVQRFAAQLPAFCPGGHGPDLAAGAEPGDAGRRAADAGLGQLSQCPCTGTGNKG